MNKLLQQAMQQAIKSADEEVSEVLNPIEPSTGQGVPLDSSTTPATPPEPPTTEEVSEVLNIKGLDTKAVLISVKRNMYSPYKLDQEESKQYGAGNVNKHLFEGRNNLVKSTISKFTEVYTYVKDNTVPWTTGVDMLNMNHYLEFTTGLRKRVDDAHRAVDTLCLSWDEEVKDDLDRLSEIAIAKGKPNLANADDYPSVDELRAKFGIEIRFMPVPTTGDFRVEISDEDKASLQKQLDDASINANKHVIKSMIEPMERAIAKLSVPIGNDGSVFRDTLVDNLVEVTERMNKINLSDDATIQDSIDNLRGLIGSYASEQGKDLLRSNQTSREKAVKDIDALCRQMSGLV